MNNTVYQDSIIISSTKLITDWPPRSLADLHLTHLETLYALTPDLLIIGTGPQFSRLDHSLIASLDQHKIHYEPMASAAACRSFMAVLAEDRHVVAAILIE